MGSFQVKFTCPLALDVRRRAITTTGTYDDPQQPPWQVSRVQVSVLLNGVMYGPFPGSFLTREEIKGRILSATGSWSAAVSLPADGQATFYVSLYALNTVMHIEYMVASGASPNVTIDDLNGTDCP